MKKSVLTIELGNLTFKVFLHGCWYNEARPVSPKHSHANFEFHIIAKGSANLETDNEVINFLEKDSVLIFPETFHTFKMKDTPSAIYSFLFSVQPNNKKGCSDFKKIFDDRLNGRNTILIFKENPKIEDYFKKFIANLYSDSIIAHESAKAWGTLFFLELFSLIDDNGASSNEPTNIPADADMRHFMIEDFFNENYMRNITSKELADKLYLSERQTDRMIKQAFGCGFKEHLTKIRLLIAKDLLAETEKEISEIALDVGYGSYNGFYMAFKNALKITPNEYREKYRKNNEKPLK